MSHFVVSPTQNNYEEEEWAGRRFVDVIDAGPGSEFTLQNRLVSLR